MLLKQTPDSQERLGRTGIFARRQKVTAIPLFLFCFGAPAPKRGSCASPLACLVLVASRSRALAHASQGGFGARPVGGSGEIREGRPRDGELLPLIPRRGPGVTSPVPREPHFVKERHASPKKPGRKPGSRGGRNPGNMTKRGRASGGARTALKPKNTKPFTPACFSSCAAAIVRNRFSAKRRAGCARIAAS
jgi:hypothetical protein